MTVANVSGNTTAGDAGLRSHAANPNAHHPRDHLLYGPNHIDVLSTQIPFEGGVLFWSDALGKFVMRPAGQLYDFGSIDGGFAISSFFGQQLQIDGGFAGSTDIVLDGGESDESYFPWAMISSSNIDGGVANSSYNLSHLVECGGAGSSYTGFQHLSGGGA